MRRAPVKMWAGCAAGMAYSADNLSLFDVVSDFDIGIFKVGVHGLESVSVVNDDHVAAVKKVAAA